MYSLPALLIQNDDGPPDHRDSPYIFGLYQYLTRELGTVTQPTFSYVPDNKSILRLGCQGGYPLVPEIMDRFRHPAFSFAI